MWGVLGTAKIAKNQMIPAIRATADAEVVAVASRDKNRSAKFAESLGIQKSYGTYEELIEDPDIDAIYIALPAAFHCEWSLKAIEAGKAVLCEKPIALNACEAKRIKHASSSRKILVSESLMYKYHLLTRTVKSLIDKGTIGEPKLMHALFLTSILDSDIRLIKELGGGALLDLGCYCASFARLIAGDEPIKISAEGILDKNGIDLTVGAVLYFSSGMIAHLSCSLVSAFDCKYAIWGEKGILSVERGALCAWPGEKFIIKISTDGQTKEIEVPEANPYKLIAEDFQNVLLGRKEKMDISLNDSIKNMETLDKIKNCLNE